MSLGLGSLQSVSYCLPTVYQTIHFNQKSASQNYLLPRISSPYSIQRRNDCIALFVTSLMCFTSAAGGVMHVYHACKYFNRKSPVATSFSYVLGSLMIGTGIYTFGQIVLKTG